jgi:hypothetical protein
MAGPKETVWDAEEHTLAKHLILKEYLVAWFPILARWNGRIVYYDGFAGPGRYKGGEEGSPLLALRVAKDHRAEIATEIVFIFVENDSRRAVHLRSELEDLKLPKNFTCQILEEEFEDALTSMLDYLDSKKARIAPTFAFIDPFGITGVPFELIQRLLRQEKCEVLITFMNHVIERWATELPEQTDRLIGVPGASQKIADSSDRVAAARKLYASSLGSAVRFVRFFEMRNTRNRPIYDLFFATNHPLGHYQMKCAMWKADESGQFRFSDGVNPDQLTVLRDDPAPKLAEALARNFRGKTVYSETILEYARDHTPYLDEHTRAALRLLELAERIKGAERKRDGKPRRKRTFPEGVRVTFPE